MTIKTSELTGAALDWAVAKCEGYFDIGMASVHDGVADVFYFDAWAPSTDWAQGGVIIEREGIMIERWVSTGYWQAANALVTKVFTAKTPLVAAMRCYVASKLGEEVEVPDELLQGESKHV